MLLQFDMGITDTMWLLHRRSQQSDERFFFICRVGLDQLISSMRNRREG